MISFNLYRDTITIRYEIMHTLKINCIKPGLYEIYERSVIYKMEIVWLSRLQRELFNFEHSETPVANWYHNLDEASKDQIHVRFARKFDNGELHSF